MLGKPNTRRSVKSKLRGLSLEQIENGIYIDFEGFGKNRFGEKLPAMCGYRIGSSGPITQVVFLDALKGAAAKSNLEFWKRKEFITWLLCKLKGGRPLFAFSNHEDRQMMKITGRKKSLRGYKNVLAIAKYHFKDRLNEIEENTLVNFCKLAGIKVPSDYGKREVTGWMREIKKHSNSKKKWANAPAEVQAKWNLLLSHNSFDVTSMFDLMVCIKEQGGPS